MGKRRELRSQLCVLMLRLQQYLSLLLLLVLQRCLMRGGCGECSLLLQVLLLEQQVLLWLGRHEEGECGCDNDDDDNENAV